MTDAEKRLVAFMDRMDRVLDELDAAKEDVKNLKSEVKNDGFNVRAFAKAVKMRRDKRARERETEDHNDLELYLAAAGQPFDLPGAGIHPSPPAQAGAAADIRYRPE